MSRGESRAVEGIARLRERSEAHLYAGQCITEVAEKFVEMMAPFEESHRGTVLKARQILINLAHSEMTVAQALADVAEQEIRAREQVAA